MKVLICDDDKCIVDEIKNNLNTFSDKHRIVFDIDSLKGIKINVLQASDIISLFGVQIK